MRISDWSSDVCSSDLLDDMAAVQRASGALAADLGQAVPRISRTEAGTLAPAFWSHREGESLPVLQFVRGGWDNLGDLPRPSLQKVEYWVRQGRLERRSEEHTSELQSLMRISYAVFCLKKKKTKTI